jgi:hypothetical protein
VKENDKKKAALNKIKKRYLVGLLVIFGIAAAVIGNVNPRADSHAHANDAPVVQKESNLFNFFKDGASVSYTVPQKLGDAVKVSFYNDINTPVDIIVLNEKYNQSTKKWVELSHERYAQVAMLKEGKMVEQEMNALKQAGKYRLRVKIIKSKLPIANQVLKEFTVN